MSLARLITHSDSAHVKLFSSKYNSSNGRAQIKLGIVPTEVMVLDVMISNNKKRMTPVRLLLFSQR
jgi:hypothetical protein